MCRSFRPVKDGSELQTSHSRQAFSFIQTIHLMNCQKSDTLAPLNKNIRRP
jgi:hypothetical protein